MKKLLAMVLTVSMTAAMVGCGQAAETTETAAESTAVETVESTAAEETATESTEESTAAEEAAGDVLSYADYVAADLDSEVTIESYVQAKQSWWEDKATVYTQDKDGAYFLYDMACSEEDYEKLVPGVKIRVTGYKSEWSGEVELMDATFEFVEGADEYIAPAVDVTDLLGTDELIDHQNQHVTFTDLTVEAAGQDADGNWGYKAGGADTVIPFKSSKVAMGGFKFLGNNGNPNGATVDVGFKPDFIMYGFLGGSDITKAFYNGGSGNDRTMVLWWTELQKEFIWDSASSNPPKCIRRSFPTGPSTGNRLALQEVTDTGFKVYGGYGSGAAFYICIKLE